MTQEFWFDFLEGSQSLHRAKHGDISVLLERLRDGCLLLDEERHLLADLIEGTVTLPQNRPGTLAIELRNIEMIETYLIERGVGEARNPAQKIAGEFDVSTTHLHRVHRQLKANAREYGRLRKRVDGQCAIYRRLEAACEDARQAHRDDIQQRWDLRSTRRALSADIKSGG